jgi:hypothetical protein
VGIIQRPTSHRRFLTRIFGIYYRSPSSRTYQCPRRVALSILQNDNSNPRIICFPMAMARFSIWMRRLWIIRIIIWTKELFLFTSCSNIRIFNLNGAATCSLADAEVKHLLLYNWLALSLVRDDTADVAAVTAYDFNDQIHVFYN